MDIPIASYRASHFAPAFLFLSSERRRALKVLYAVCRTLDDAVDNGHPDARNFLKAWRDCFVEHRPEALRPYQQELLAREFIDVVNRYTIPTFALTDLIDKGVGIDLSKPVFQTPLETEDYCYGVAGTVGIACLPIFGVPWQEAKDFAVRLGITVQRVNIIRDVGADVKMGRVYLPLDHLDRFGYTRSDLFALKNSPQFGELMRNEAHVARSHYTRALDLLPQRWKRELLPARIMGQIYMRLLDKLERQSFPVLQRKVRLNIFERISAVWNTIYG